MTRWVFVGIISLVGCWVLGIVCADRALAVPLMGYSLTWSDEFNGSSLDTSRWEHSRLGPRRSAINTPDAISVSGGNLTITTYTSGGTHYTGIIASKDMFRYGYYEARIRFHDASGEWSAFWLTSPTMGDPIGNAAVAGSEIDIVEHRKIYGGPEFPNATPGEDLSNKMDGGVIWDGYGADQKYEFFVSPDLGLAAGFHLYGLAWDENGYRFYVDDVLQYTIDDPRSLSNRPEYMLLSSEVGEWLAGPVPDEGYGDMASSTTKMDVDYVRVYSPVPEPSTLVVLLVGGALGALGCAWRRRARVSPAR